MSTSLLSIFLLGLFAGGVSCAAVQGGLLAGLVSRQKTAHNDIAPVGGFLAGKLLSHTVLGALLGALGGAVQLSLHVRTMAQLVAGVLIIAMGLAQLGVPGFRGLVFEPPAAWSRFVRGRARSESLFAPAMLGLASVLIPCGVTLSVMALAITTGSPWLGAAVMAVFVAGTAPLFAVLGYAAAKARRAAGAWQKRLAVLTGLLVLAAGLYTFNGGLELSGSPLAVSQISAALAEEKPPPEASATVEQGRQTVVVVAVTDAYMPEDQRVTAGVQTTLIIRSQQARGCVRAFVIPSLNLERTLPVNGDTAIDVGSLKPGKLRYSCGMGMYTGQLTVVAAGS